MTLPRCPFCSGRLEAGTLLVHARDGFTRLRALLTSGNVPRLDLFFYPAGSDRGRRLLDHGEERRGFHCGDYGAIISVPTHPVSERRTCTACGEPIPAAHSASWSCGSTDGGVAPPES